MHRQTHYIFSISSILENMFTCVSQTQVVMTFIARFFFYMGNLAFTIIGWIPRIFWLVWSGRNMSGLISWGQDTGMDKWRQVISTTPCHSFLCFVHPCYKCIPVDWSSVILPFLSILLTLSIQVLHFPSWTHSQETAPKQRNTFTSLPFCGMSKVSCASTQAMLWKLIINFSN